MEYSKLYRNAMIFLNAPPEDADTNDFTAPKTYGLCSVLNFALQGSVINAFQEGELASKALFATGENMKQEAFSYNLYWLIPNTNGNYASSPYEARKAYTARIMLLELGALLAEEDEAWVLIEAES